MSNNQINQLIELIKEIAASQVREMGTTWCSQVLDKLESLKQFDP